MGALRPGGQQPGLDPVRARRRHGQGARPRPQTAKEAAPEDPQGSDTLAWIFYRRGVHQRALALLKDSVTKLPCNPQIQYHLGMVSAHAGDKEAARQALSAAASPTPFPGQEEAKKALAALR